MSYNSGGVVLLICMILFSLSLISSKVNWSYFLVVDLVVIVIQIRIVAALLLVVAVLLAKNQLRVYG
jgi:O-antigen ligase